MSQHKAAPFKVADGLRWTVIVSSREHVEELVRAPEEELSIMEGSNDVSCSILLGLGCTEYPRQRLNIRYMLGDEVLHIGSIRTHLTRDIAKLYPETRDEIVTAFDELLDLTGEGGVFDSIINWHVLISRNLRVEECTSSASHTKGRLPDKQQNICWPSVVFVFHVSLPVTLCVTRFISLGRDPDWIDLNIQYTFVIGKAGVLLGLFPEFLRP